MSYEDGATPPTGETTARNDSGQPEPVLTADQWQQVAGERSVVDPEEADDLDPTDPNLAAAGGDNDHTNFIGDVSDEDLGVEAAGHLLDTEPATTGEDDSGGGA